MAGPLTPPITSAIEIEDAARTEVATETTEPSGSVSTAPGEAAAVAPQAVAPQTTDQSLTVFRPLFTNLSQLAAEGKFEELVEAAELADLSVRVF